MWLFWFDTREQSTTYELARGSLASAEAAAVRRSPTTLSHVPTSEPPLKVRESLLSRGDIHAHPKDCQDLDGATPGTALPPPRPPASGPRPGLPVVVGDVQGDGSGRPGRSPQTPV